MSGDDQSGSVSGGGRSMSGGANEPMPSTWNRPSQAPRIGRIGAWSSPSGGNQRAGGLSGSSRGGSMPSPDDDDDDDEEEDKGENWFAGGERSGLSVQNPNSAPRVPGGDMVRDLLRRAAEGGRAPPPATSSVFSGGGNTLGSDDVPSSFVPDPSARGEDTAIRHITFWRNGFTIENGELLRYDDPNNAQILSQIQSGNAPPSVLNVRVGQEVEVRIDKRIGEDYVEPKGAKTFVGSGHRLGAPVPSVSSGAGSSVAMPGSFPYSSDASSAPLSPRENITTRFAVDQTLPTTSVQIRLADGTRMVCRMNLTHRVIDLRNFINASRPENLSRPYTIGTTFPNRTLDDDNATIESSGLANSVVVQRWV